ncbi:hypothetical protein VTI74DRAFT_10148 [Chaetomium olivicolor]
MAPNLSTLPVETLSLILSQFCLHCSKEHDYESPDGYFRCKTHEQQPDQPSWYSRDYRQTLYSMCLLSKRLTSIAQIFLYHEFVPGYGDAWKSAQFSWDGRLSSFLRTIAARRDLAAQVKRIYIHPYLLRAVTEEEAQVTLEDALNAAAAPGAGVQLSEYLSAFDEMGNQRAFFPGPTRYPGWKLLGMLLTLALNLERLSLQVDGSGCVPAAAFSALYSLSSSGTVLSNLKTLDFCPHSHGWVFFLKHHAEGILEAVAASKGSLSTLNLHMCGGIGQVKLQGLQVLRLTYSRLYSEDLSALLDSCRTPGLKSFYYEARHPYMWSACLHDSLRYEGHMQPIDAITRLFPHASTLTSLHLDLRARGLANLLIDNQGLSEAQTTMARFPVLKHVFLNPTAICNSQEHRPSVTDDDDQLLTDLLPPNIESLSLAGGVQDAVRARIAKALMHLAKIVKNGKQFTALKQVRCDFEMDGGGVLEGYGVSEAFEFAGVDFAYDSLEMSCGPTLRFGEGTPEREMELGCEMENYSPIPDDDDDL